MNTNYTISDFINPSVVYTELAEVCNYTVPLELTLSKIVENFQIHPMAPPVRQHRSNTRKMIP